MAPALKPLPIIAQGLAKRYPNGTQALRGIDLTVEPGEVFGLIGPNGAGKSTLLKVLSGLLTPERGSVLFGGHNVTGNPVEAARYAGFMPDPLGVYTDLTSREYLEFFGRLMGLAEKERGERMEDTIGLLGLEPWLEAEVETLSAGWQRRLALGRVLMAGTPVLLLDEPAAGLDVAARSDLLDTVRKLAGTGRTIVISSHILPELEQLADRFALMNKGEWLEMVPGHVKFSRSDLRQGAHWILRGRPIQAAADLMSRSGLCWRLDGDVLEMDVDDDRAAALLPEFVRIGVHVEEFKRREKGLAEAVLKALKAEEEKR